MTVANGRTDGVAASGVTVVSSYYNSALENWSSVQGATCTSLGGGRAACAIGDVPAGAQRSFIVTLTARNAGTDSRTFTATSAGDPAMTGTAGYTTTVDPPAGQPAPAPLPVLGRHSAAISVAAAEVNRNGATIRVTLAARQIGSWELDYGRSTAYGQSLGTHGFSPETVIMTFRLQRLLPGTTYHVRGVARTPAFPPYTETDRSGDISFKTLPAVKPTARILSVQTIPDCACASVKAGFFFGGLRTTVHVEYGGTRRLGRTTGAKSFPAWADVDGQGIAQTFDVPANDRLKPGTYYFRVVAVNKLGRALSPIQSFAIAGPA